MKTKLKYILIIGGALTALFVVVGGLNRTAHGVTSGNLSITSADVISDQSLMTGSSTTKISVGLMSANGENVGNVNVHVQLLQNGIVMDEAIYNNRDILHENSQLFWLTPNVAPGTYTLAVLVLNQNGTPNASFPNLGSVTIGNNGVSGGVGNSTSTPGNSTSTIGNSTSTTGGGTSTSTASSTPGAVNGSVRVVSVDRVKDNLTEGNTMTIITANLISPNANTNNATVHVELLQNGTVVSDAVYSNRDILHESSQAFRLVTGSNLPVGDYTIAVLVFNGNGSLNSSFPNLGTITVVPTGTSSSTTNTTSTTGNTTSTMHIVANSGSVNQTNITPSSTVTMTVNYINSDNVNPFTGSIHMQLFNSSESVVSEQDFNNLTFAPSETKTLQMTSTAGLMPGTYHFEDKLFFADGTQGGSDMIFNGTSSVFTVSTASTTPSSTLTATLGPGSDRSAFMVTLGSQNIDLLNSVNMRVRLLDASGTVAASQILNGNFIYSTSTGPARDFFWGVSPSPCGTGLPPAGGTFQTQVIVMNQSTTVQTFDNIGNQTFAPQPGCTAIMQ